jgi:hypothetical protein
MCSREPAGPGSYCESVNGVLATSAAQGVYQYALLTAGLCFFCAAAAALQLRAGRRSYRPNRTVAGSPLVQRWTAANKQALEMQSTSYPRLISALLVLGTVAALIGVVGLVVYFA